MKLLDFFKKPDHPIPLPPSPPPLLPYAFACLDCDAICNGSMKGRCRKCKSERIFHIRSMYEHVRAKAAQHVKVAETIREARARKERNELALRTEFRDPKDAA